MFQALSDLYTLGELDQVKQKLLHTTSWKQHEFTAYGQSQIEKAWLSSIALFGFSHLLEKQFIKGEKHSAIFLKLANKNNDELSFSLIFEHNKDVIKRVNCIVDTQRLATFAQVSVDEILASLPTPDPLFISQFDHQLHPQSYHASPNDLAELPESMNEAISTWWSIWQANKVSAFNELYHDDATALISGDNATGNSDTSAAQALRQFKLQLVNRVTRSYSQLEQIALDESANALAIAWSIDGDFIDDGVTKRVRIPVQSFLTIKDNKIVDEKLNIDWLALKKRFNLSNDIL